MGSLYRLSTITLLDASPRKVVSASFSHSVVLSSTALSAEPLESPSVPRIFDVPAKFRERNVPNDSLKALNSLSATRATWRVGPPHSQKIYNIASDLPWSLPPPTTFDGPACPPHMSPSVLQRYRRQRQNLIHSSSGAHGASAVSCGALTSPSELHYQLFDGPSRITRYQYPTSQNERCSFTCLSLALCLFSSFGWLVLKDQSDVLQQISVRSL